jgi:hypothetical protein
MKEKSFTVRPALTPYGSTWPQSGPAALPSQRGAFGTPEAFENDAAPEKSAARNKEAFDRDVEEAVERIKNRAHRKAAVERATRQAKGRTPKP